MHNHCRVSVRTQQKYIIIYACTFYVDSRQDIYNFMKMMRVMIIIIISMPYIIILQKVKTYHTNYTILVANYYKLLCQHNFIILYTKNTITVTWQIYCGSLQLSVDQAVLLL